MAHEERRKSIGAEERYWKTSFEAKSKEFAELALAYKEFQQSSHEFESELESELHQAQEEVERCQSRLAKTENQLRKTREEAKAMRDQYEEEVANLRNQLSRATSANNAQSEDAKWKEKVEEQRKRASHEIKELQQRLDKAIEDYELLQADFEEMEQQSKEMIQQLRNENHSLHADALAKPSSQGTIPQDQYASLINELKEDIQAQNKTIASLTEEKEQLQQRLVEETELNERLTQEVSDLTDDFMANSEKIDQLERTLQDVNKELEDAYAKLEAVRADPSGAAAQSTSKPTSSTSRTITDTKYEELLEEKDKYAEELKIQHELNQSLMVEIEQLSKKPSELEPLQKDLEQKQTQLMDAINKSQRLEEELFEANSKYTDTEARLMDVEKKLKEAQEILKDQARAGAANFEEAVRERTDLKDRITRLEQREQELLKELEKERKAHAQLKSGIEREQAVQEKLREERNKHNAERAAELQRLLSQKGGKGSKSMAVSANLSSTRSVMSSMGEDIGNSTRQLLSDFSTLGTAISQLTDVLVSTQSNYRALVHDSRRLFDDLQDMKGNIKVYCRVRPLLPNEIDQGIENVIELPGNNQVSMIRKGKDRSKESMEFSFDRVYGPGASQTEVFQDVQSLVLSVLDGYNVCIFAYGQTGSGKTFTMEGSPSNLGVNYRAMDALFAKIKSLAPQFLFKIHVSLVEIYNEHLRDLLDSDSAQILKQIDQDQKTEVDAEEKDGPLQIRKGPNGVYVTNLNKFFVRTPEEVMEVLATGAKNRMSEATNANEHSSRSHSILIVEVDGFDQVTQNRTHGKLQLVDLAGSERVKETESTGQRLVEATYINKSLSALGDVMTALSAPKKGGFIPFRNSKLTYLLQDSLGGNSKTMMFVNVSPADKHAQETMCSLQFAKRVRLVRLTATATVENAALNKYKQQVEEANEQKRDLEEKSKRAIAKLEEKLKQKEDQIFELNEQLKSGAAKMNQFELQKKKEIAELAQQQSRLAKMGVQSDTKKVEEKWVKKHQQLAEKYEQVCNLLKLSQRENKALKEAAEQKTSQVKSQAENSQSKAKNLEEELERASRAARKEALARKKAEEEGQNLERKYAKELEDKDQLIRALRDKCRKLQLETQQLRTAMKRAKVQERLEDGVPADEEDGKIPEEESKPITSSASETGFPATTLSGSAARIQERLQDYVRKSHWDNNESSKLSRPRNWRYRDQLVSIRDIISSRSAPASRSASASAPRNRSSGVPNGRSGNISSQQSDAGDTRERGRSASGQPSKS